MKRCEFVIIGNLTWVPPADNWMGGWSRQRWLERHFGEGNVRNASPSHWARLFESNDVFILKELQGIYSEEKIERDLNPRSFCVQPKEKLVRDKIPEIIQASNRKPVYFKARQKEMDKLYGDWLPKGERPMTVKSTPSAAQIKKASNTTTNKET